jgi:outer membrane protein OmpA-like peptidoglycan-associated protein
MKKFFGILFIWGLVLGGAGATYWFLFYEPDLTNPNNPNPVVVPAGMTEIKLALDSFSGYCVFRSKEFEKKLAEKKLFLHWEDDEANYTKRMESIKKGDRPYAVFTIDALINTTPKSGEPPATIVMFIDETRGADAMVAYEDGVKTIDALNSPRAKVVLLPDSPSETLMRIVRSEFDLPDLPKERDKYLIKAKDVEDVYQRFLRGKQTDPTAYVLWEPYVSLALQQTGAKRLIDSGHFKGMIVDVLVVQTNYLRKHPEEVKTVVRAYLEVLHQALQSKNGMTRLVQLDADIIKESHVKENADAVVNGIWWKNTMENYAHFGLLPPNQRIGYLQPGDMIKNITAVLEKTKQDTEQSSVLDRPDKLADATILKELYEQTQGALNSDEHIRQEDDVLAIKDADWTKLKEVGSLKVKDVEFPKALKLSPDAEDALAELALDLKRWPKYYLRIEGNTTNEGEREANLKKAQERADYVKNYMIDKFNIPAARLQAFGKPPGGGIKVGFVFLEQP